MNRMDISALKSICCRPCFFFFPVAAAHVFGFSPFPLDTQAIPKQRLMEALRPDGLFQRSMIWKPPSANQSLVLCLGILHVKGGFRQTANRARGETGLPIKKFYRGIPQCRFVNYVLCTSALVTLGISQLLVLVMVPLVLPNVLWASC